MNGHRALALNTRALLSVAVTISLLLSVSATGSRAAVSRAGAPITIGVSVSLTGDFSGDGQSIRRGYTLWQNEVNRAGGLLGRPVQLKILDDASSTTQITTNMQKLITVDHVDLVFGPFSSLLTIPAATVAYRYGYAFPEPAGGGPMVFAKRLPNLFFVQPAPVAYNLASFARWLLSLPRSIRPRSAAYSTEDDPFARPQINIARGMLQRGGIRTVYSSVFPSETTDYAPIALAIVHSHADVVLLGTTGLPEATGFIKGFIQQHYNPKALVESSGPDQGGQFGGAIGWRNTEGIVVPAGWWVGARTFHNRVFVSEYLRAYGGKPGEVSSDAAEAYSVGQVVQQAVSRIHTINNAALIRELHRDRFETIQGPIKFNSIGQPQGQMFLVQWQHSRAVPVYPPSVAIARPEYPKPVWR